jgi:hypothetical protein
MQGRPSIFAVQGMDIMQEQDLEKIRNIIARKAERFRSRMGDVTLAGIEGGTVKIAPSGYCWR